MRATAKPSAVSAASGIELPLDPRPAITLGMVTIALVFGGFGTWAALAPIASAVIAPGSVTVDSNRKKVQHLDGGIVKELLVRDGAEVKAGDTLVRLDEVQPRAALDTLQAGLDAARALQARLVAENNKLRQLDFPPDLLARAGQARVAEALKGQQEQFDARRVALAGMTAILDKRIGQLKENVAGLQSQQRAKTIQIDSLDEEIRGERELLGLGYSTRPRLAALERERADLDGKRGEHVSEIARAKTTIAETEIQILQLQKDQREKVVDELRTIRTQITDLEQRIGAARHVLENIDIRASVGGVVVGMQVHTIGGVVRAGDTLLEIVPKDDRLIVEAQVQPIDIDGIEVGQQADVRLTAFKAWITPTIVGKVVYVSADRVGALRPDAAQPDQQPHFLARIAVGDDQLARLGGRRLHPGMPAEVMIRTGERTTLQYLAQPFTDRIEKAWRDD